MNQTHKRWPRFLRRGVLLCCLGAWLRIATAQTCVEPPTGVVSWWPGTAARDLIDDNHGILKNGVASKRGMIGRAFDFDGVNDFVQVPWAPTLDVGHAVTLEFWMRGAPSNAMDTCCQGLVTTDFYLIEISGGHGETIGLNFAISTDGGASFQHTSDLTSGGFPIAPGEWHHVAGVYDGTSLRLYVDGVLRAETPHTGTISSMLPRSFLAIGSEDGRRTCRNCIKTRYFHGRIDDVALYNRALTALEIQALVTAGSTGKCRPVGGVANGTSVEQVVCTNLTSGETRIIADGRAQWDCEDAGLVIQHGDRIEQTVIGAAD